jgi:capsular polysaccharide transport system permease protein
MPRNTSRSDDRRGADEREGKGKAVFVTQFDQPVTIREIKLTRVASGGELVASNGECVPALEEQPAPVVQTSFFGRYRLFILTVVVPCFLSAIYLFLIASDRYVSEAQFIVRSASGSGYETAQTMVESRGLSKAKDETFVVGKYIESRDALEWLIRNEDLRSVFSRPEADFVNRFPNFFTRDTRESYYKYYKRMVSSDIDESTGISTISVIAFTPEDAHRLSSALLRSAEDLINRINERAERDAVGYADKDVVRAYDRVADVEQRLKVFRSEVGFVDAQRESAAALQTITRLSTELAQIRTSLQQQQALTPNSPALASLREKAQSYQDEIARRKSAIAGDTISIASKMDTYDGLMLEKTIAEKALASAENNRLIAQQSATQQHLYLQTVVEPNVADIPTYPRRFLYFLLTFVCSATIFVIIRNMRQFAYEHAL